MPDDPNDAPKQSNPLRNLVQAESVLQLALAIPAGCFVGLGIGYLLDRHFHTKWIAITLMFLGAIGGLVQLFTFLARSSKRGGE
jgi:ATP synthase protein I